MRWKRSGPMARHAGFFWRSGASCAVIPAPGSAVRRVSILSPNILTRENRLMNGNRNNMFLAIALSALVIFGGQYFVVAPQMKADQARQAALAHQVKPQPQSAAEPASVPGMAGSTAHMTRTAALK